jgi:hypothetical protein
VLSSISSPQTPVQASEYLCDGRMDLASGLQIELPQEFDLEIPVLEKTMPIRLM